MTKEGEIISQRVRALPPSPIRRFFDLVESMPDAISLSVGEPDFVTPWHIREAAIYSLERGQTHYTPNRGTRELRQEISSYLARRFGLEYDPETEILVTLGVSEGLDLACRALLDPGDRIVFPEPCYVAYRPCASLAGAAPVGIATTMEQGFKVTPEQVRAAGLGLAASQPSPGGGWARGRPSAALRACPECHEGAGRTPRRAALAKRRPPLDSARGGPSDRGKGDPEPACPERSRRVEGPLPGRGVTAAKALLLGYPSNPTGVALSAQEMAALAAVAQELDLLVIADELYAELRYDAAPISFAAAPGMRERTVLLSGFSKALAMTGWRLGYACGPAHIIDAMTKIHGYTALCAPVTAQRAAAEGMRRAEREVEQMLAEYGRRRRVVMSRLRKMGLPCFEPQGAFYAFPSIVSTGMTSQEFAERLLVEQKVAVVPGDAFGECGAGHIRICYATGISLLEEALERMARWARLR